MTRTKDLKKEDKTIYYGYAFPRRRGDFCRISNIINDKTVIIVFESDQFCTPCNPGHLKKVEMNSCEP